MRIFLDECVNGRLARELIGHDVRSARQMGWSGVRNGALLKLVAASFDVFLTLDRGIAHQQNVTGLDLAVIILRTPTNRMLDLRPRLPALMAALDQSPVGAVTIVDPI